MCWVKFPRTKYKERPAGENFQDRGTRNAGQRKICNNKESSIYEIYE